MRFDPNHSEIDKLKDLAPVDVMCHSLADRVRDFIQSFAPRRAHAEYARSWQVVKMINGGGWSVRTDDYKAWWIEKGVRPHGNHPGNPAHHLAQRALDSLVRR